jgi:chemotaxis protein MotB
VLADAMAEAFGGPPKSIRPMQIGRPQLGNSRTDASTSQAPPATRVPQRQTPPISTTIRMPVEPRSGLSPEGAKEVQKLQEIADAVQKALAPLIEKNLVVVRRTESWVEIEIKTDILFDSGSAKIDAHAIPVLGQLADILQPHPNRIRIEGHTDNRPIATWQFPSNWELSAARAASVVHRFARAGISPARLSVIGFGEFRPAESNDTVAGRDANRRVVIVILAGEGAPAPADAAGFGREAPQGDAADAQALEPVNTPADVNNVTPATPPATAAGTETAPVPVTLGAGAGNPAQE